MCGGTHPRRHDISDLQGLSPRVRGNPEHPVGLIHNTGSIPACAGEPTRNCGRSCKARVYPRVCGGTSLSRRGNWRRTGLSPRVRGNRARHQAQDLSNGSIPACAGEPPSTRRRFRRPWVYPRVCGGTSSAPFHRLPTAGLSPGVRGNLSHWSCFPLGSGSIPRVRGNPAQMADAAAGQGSIPACAGEPALDRGAVAVARVYPRVCGGTLVVRVRQLDEEGLSPRVRGNPRRASLRAWLRGSIPACAGEPRRQQCSTSTMWVYPRVCGGTSEQMWRFRDHTGLSPRVRGNRLAGARPLGDAGSIPACAGEPAAGGDVAGAAWVYPRVCGGTRLSARLSARLQGLSPRVRGNPTCRSFLVGWAGSIPACAGEPLGVNTLFYLTS